MGRWRGSIPRRGQGMSEETWTGPRKMNGVEVAGARRPG